MKKYFIILLLFACSISYGQSLTTSNGNFNKLKFNLLYSGADSVIYRDADSTRQFHYKNVVDPVYPTDAVNLRTLQNFSSGYDSIYFNPLTGYWIGLIDGVHVDSVSLDGRYKLKTDSTDQYVYDQIEVGGTSAVVNYPFIFDTINYRLDIYAYTIETNGGKTYEVSNPIFNTVKTVSGFSCSVLNSGGYLRYSAYDTLTVYATAPFPDAILRDQTIKQTIVNGVPELESTRVISGANDLVDVAYVDSSIGEIVSQTITNGVTTKAPSEDAVFDQVLTNPYFNGAIDVFDAEKTRENFGLKYATTFITDSIATWGDSMTAGAGGDGTTIQTTLTTLSGVNYIYNGGVGGETSTQIKTRMLTAADKYDWPTSLWGGRNNYTDTTTVLADIAAMKAALTTEKYVVLAVCNGEYTYEYEGAQGWIYITQLNKSLKRIYGDHFIDVRQHLVSKYDPENAQDVLDFTHDVVPSSLRADAVHLNGAGYAIVGELIFEKLSLFGGGNIPTAGMIKHNDIASGYIAKKSDNGGLSQSIIKEYSGNIGLGIATPSYLLDITKSSNSGDYTGFPTSSINNSLVTRGNGSSTFNFAANRVSAGNGAVVGAMVASYNSDGNSGDGVQLMSNVGASIWTASVRRFTVQADGKVGIGTTATAATAKLDIQGAGSTSPLLVVSNDKNATKDSTFTVLANGNVGIGTTAPTAKLSIAEKGAMNELGGQMIKLTNKTGANSVKGTVVAASSTTDNAFMVNPTSGDMPIGVVWDAGIADGSECWVVVGGVAEILAVNAAATTRGYVAYSSTTVEGRMDIAAAVPAAATHFTEIGHTNESKTAGTNVLVKCVIHFN